MAVARIRQLRNVYNQCRRQPDSRHGNRCNEYQQHRERHRWKWQRHNYSRCECQHVERRRGRRHLQVQQWLGRGHGDGQRGQRHADFSAVTTSLVFNFNGVAVSSGGSTVSYGGIENFIGGTNNDTFIFVDGASVVGNVDGKSGTDTLDFSAMTAARNVVLTSIGSVDGFNGTANGIGGTFNNINNVIASSANSDTLTGANLVTQWSLSAISNTLSAISQLTFSNFETLQGGSAVDTFSITGAVNNTLNGGAGDDLLLLNEGASWRRVQRRERQRHTEPHHAHIGSHCELGDSHCH